MKKQRKAFIAKSEADEHARTVTSLISTQVVDRDGDVMIAQGMDASRENTQAVFENTDATIAVGGSPLGGANASE